MNSFFFFAEEEIFKRKLQLFSNRRKVEIADTEKVTNITSGGGGMGKLCIPRVDKKNLTAKGTMHLSYLKYSFQKCIMHQQCLGFIGIHKQICFFWEFKLHRFYACKFN